MCLFSSAGAHGDPNLGGVGLEVGTGSCSPAYSVHTLLRKELVGFHLPLI